MIIASKVKTFEINLIKTQILIIKISKSNYFSDI